MHREVEQFVASVKKQAPEFFTGQKVLEVGSLDINGSVRQFFENCQYTGIDLGEGKGVDVVAHVTDYHRLDDGEFDVIISSEALEHDHRWSESLKAMHRLLKPNGLLLITCAAPNREPHGIPSWNNAHASPFTNDHYRNISVEDFASVLPADLFSKSYLGYRGNMDDLYFAGVKSAKSHMADALKEQFDRQWAKGLESTRTLTALAELPVKDKRTVIAEVSTKDRYHILPACLTAILMQTRKPDKLVIYDDGEQKELKDTPPFDGLLQLAIDNLGIQWTYYSTERKGQVSNHQHALDNATTDLIWRIDDDEIPEPNCLENLLAEMQDGVGAVAGLVHHPRNVTPLPEHVTGTIDDIALGTNIQWFDWNGGPREVAHLYSTFLYSVEAARKAGGYPTELSTVGHREESWFTIRLRQAGYKLIVTPSAKTWHLRQSTGGIRTFSDTSLWEHDDKLFQEYLKTIGVSAESKLCILDSGLGDHLLFRGLLVDEFMPKHPNRRWKLAVCYPEAFSDLDNVDIISIAEAQQIVGDRYQDYSLFEHGWHHGNGRHILDVMREFYG